MALNDDYRRIWTLPAKRTGFKVPEAYANIFIDQMAKTPHENFGFGKSLVNRNKIKINLLPSANLVHPHSLHLTALPPGAWCQRPPQQATNEDEDMEMVVPAQNISENCTQISPYSPPQDYGSSTQASNKIYYDIPPYKEWHPIPMQPMKPHAESTSNKARRSFRLSKVPRVDYSLLRDDDDGNPLDEDLASTKIVGAVSVFSYYLRNRVYIMQSVDNASIKRWKLNFEKLDEQQKRIYQNELDMEKLYVEKLKSQCQIQLDDNLLPEVDTDLYIIAKPCGYRDYNIHSQIQLFKLLNSTTNDDWVTTDLDYIGTRQFWTNIITHRYKAKVNDNTSLLNAGYDMNRLKYWEICNHLLYNKRIDSVIVENIMKNFFSQYEEKINRKKKKSKVGNFCQAFIRTGFDKSPYKKLRKIDVDEFRLTLNPITICMFDEFCVRMNVTYYHNVKVHIFPIRVFSCTSDENGLQYPKLCVSTLNAIDLKDFKLLLFPLYQQSFYNRNEDHMILAFVNLELMSVSWFDPSGSPDKEEDIKGLVKLLNDYNREIIKYETQHLDSVLPCQKLGNPDLNEFKLGIQYLPMVQGYNQCGVTIVNLLYNMMIGKEFPFILPIEYYMEVRKELVFMLLSDFAIDFLSSVHLLTIGSNE